jgi:y4mF family transcriptional regulator
MQAAPQTGKKRPAGLPKLPDREYICWYCHYLGIFYRSVISHLQIAVIFRNIPLGNMDSTSLGLIVRRERKAQKLKQAELAAVSGVGIRFVVDLEAGKPTLQLEKVLRVVTTLGCEITITPPAGGA